MHIYAVIPARNEAATIADVAARAGDYVEGVIVVDDASSDATPGIAQQVAGIRVLRNTYNRGKAGSIWRGIEEALDKNADAVITLDGDGQHRPEEIPALIRAAEDHPDHIIIGARMRGRANIPRLRRLANRVANVWISKVAGYRIVDSQSGFRLYPAGLLRQLTIPHDRAHGFVWESEVLIEAARLGFGSMPVTIDAIYKPTARSSHYRDVTDTVRITRMLVWRTIQRQLTSRNRRPSLE